jgi:hypothetical protein
MARAKRDRGRTAPDTFRVFLLATPREITPRVAARWMRSTFPKLTDFAHLGFYPWALQPPRHRDEIRIALASLASDADVMALACAHALATGRTARVEFRPLLPLHPEIVRKLRLALAFEARESHGVRTVLRRTIAQAQRDIRRAKKAA